MGRKTAWADTSTALAAFELKKGKEKLVPGTTWGIVCIPRIARLNVFVETCFEFSNGTGSRLDKVVI
jgi:hypothetical protein